MGGPGEQSFLSFDEVERLSAHWVAGVMRWVVVEPVAESEDFAELLLNVVKILLD